MLKQFRLYISPAFLPRYYIRRDVRKVLDKYKFDGSVFDYGCGQKPYADMFTKCKRYIGIDFADYSINKDMHSGEPDLFFDKDFSKTFKLPFDNNSFEHCVSFQVLEHHIDPQKMIAEMARVTKRRGYILLTAPFLGGLHEEPHDYQRLTKYGLKTLLKDHGYKVKLIKEEGSLFSTTAMLFNEYLISCASHGGLKRLLCYLIYPLFLLFSYIAFVLDKIIKTDKIIFNYLVVAQKVT